jgi:uncharacterized protein (DUF1501 family)
MIVPWRQDAYFRARPTLALAPDSLHRLDDDHGLHPEMGGLARLHEEGWVAVVHGVGYPNPDRSHFRSMEIWHTADPECSPREQGWLGRLADQVAERDPSAFAAIHVGTEDLPLALYGRKYFSPTVRDASGFRLESLGKGFEEAREGLLDRRERGEEEFLRLAARSSYRAARRMAELVQENSSVAYPDHELASHLKLVARLIAGGFGTRIFHVALGGFDTHARQAPVHARLMRELSSGLEAFLRDLHALGMLERVLVLVFSEFGRRVEENGSRGTDHGAAAPVLLLGGTVRGGGYGSSPDLLQLAEGDVPFTTDYRAIYATVERDWMGLEPSTRTRGLELVLPHR